MDEENKIYGRKEIYEKRNSFILLPLISVRAYAGETEDVAGQEDVS